MNNLRLSNLTKPVRQCVWASWIIPLLLLLVLPAAVHAQSFTYVTNNGAITITGYTGPGGNVTIPSTIAGLPVTSIANSAFYNNSSFISVTLPGGVTNIGSQAFELCTGLTNVAMPATVRNIGSFAFTYCSSLRSVVLPAGLTSIQYEVFFGCTSLASVTLPEGITSIEYGAFQLCDSLTIVTLPKTVTSIQVGPFANCPMLEAINVEAGNPSYASLAGVLFDKNISTLIQCPGGKAGTYLIPATVTNIASTAFFGCGNLTGVTIPDTVNSFGGSVFQGCGLTNVRLPPRLTSIPPNTFLGCSRLVNVSIPSSVTSIGGNAFNGCGSLPSISIPGSVTSIEGGAFDDCFSLTKVEIPDSVTEIGAGAFLGCTSLTSINLPSRLTSIEMETFGYCSALTNVTIPNKVTSVGYMAFFNCYSLTTVSFGLGVTNVADGVFSGCSQLAGVYFQCNAPSFVGTGVFQGDTGATVYYLPGTSGWGATFAGRPTALWPPPTIQTPPQTQTAEVGSDVEFSVLARSVGDLVLGYEWFFNGTTPLSCTNPVLQLAGVQYSQAGAYMVVVTNAAGAVTSPPALLSVIAPVERRIVPALTLMGQPGTSLNLDFTAALGPAPLWTTFDQVEVTAASQWYFDLSSPVPPQGFYRAWQTSAGMPSALDLHFVPAITLTGAIGSSVRVDYINQFGPIDAWVTNLANVTLTNTSQLYFDVSSIGRPQRLWRIVPVPQKSA